MKNRILSLVVASILLAGSASAQAYFPKYEKYCQANLDRAAKVYAISLDSPTEGIVLSTLAHIGRIKLYFPDLRFPELEKKVTELSINGQTAGIRYRAFLVMNVFVTPAIFRNDSFAQYNDGEALFSALAQRLDSTMLGSMNAQ